MLFSFHTLKLEAKISFNYVVALNLQNIPNFISLFLLKNILYFLNFLILVVTLQLFYSTIFYGTEMVATVEVNKM